MQAAKAAGAVTSFDLNYRAKLWNIWGGPEKAQDVMRRIVRTTSMCWSATKRTCKWGWASPGPKSRSEIEARPERVLRHDRQRRQAATRRSRSSPPRCARSIRPTGTAGAPCAWIDGKPTSPRPASSDVLRPGRRRRWFCGGFFYGLLTGEPRRKKRSTWAGPRRAADHVPRRHHDGDRGAGTRICAGWITQLGRANTGEEGLGTRDCVGSRAGMPYHYLIPGP